MFKVKIKLKSQVKTDLNFQYDEFYIFHLAMHQPMPQQTIRYHETELFIIQNLL